MANCGGGRVVTVSTTFLVTVGRGALPVGAGTGAAPGWGGGGEAWEDGLAGGEWFWVGGIGTAPGWGGGGAEEGSKVAAVVVAVVRVGVGWGCCCGGWAVWGVVPSGFVAAVCGLMGASE